MSEQNPNAPDASAVQARVLRVDTVDGYRVAECQILQGSRKQKISARLRPIFSGFHVPEPLPGAIVKVQRLMDDWEAGATITHEFSKSPSVGGSRNFEIHAPADVRIFTKSDGEMRLGEPEKGGDWANLATQEQVASLQAQINLLGALLNTCGITPAGPVGPEGLPLPSPGGPFSAYLAGVASTPVLGFPLDSATGYGYARNVQARTQEKGS